MYTEAEVNAKITTKQKQYDTLLQESKAGIEKALKLDGDKFNAETLGNLADIVVALIKAGVLGNEIGLLRNCLKANKAKTPVTPVRPTPPAPAVKLQKHSMFHNG